MSKAIEVIDKNGNRVTRHNGILADGDSMRVPVKLMDARMMPPPDPTLQAAMDEARALRRQEGFDAKAHRPRYGVVDQDTAANSEKTRDAYQSRLNNSWRNPAQPPIDPLDWTHGQQPPSPSPRKTQSDSSPPPSHDALIAARDNRIEQAWRQ